MLDVYSGKQGEAGRGMRRGLLDRVYGRVAGEGREISPAMKFRAVMIYYHGYFREKKNITVL